MGLEDDDTVVNLQADTVSLDKEALRFCLNTDRCKPYIASTYYKTSNIMHSSNPNTVKVVTAENNVAMYFSRLPIPYNSDYYKIHIGIYGFKKHQLDTITKHVGSKLSEQEKLEQLSWLYNGEQIKMKEVGFAHQIDTREDYEQWIKSS